MIDRADWSGYLSVLNMKQQQLKSFTELTRSKFPDDADEADIILEELCFEKEDEAYYLWFESLAEMTSKNMKNDLKETVK